MTDSHIRNVIEAALLAAGKPLQAADLVDLFDDGAERPTLAGVQAALAALAEEYSTRGIEIKETAAGFRIQVRADFSNEISRLWPERPAKYSRALLETLAIIAYRQPITRAEIEAVRGVPVNPNIVKTIVERNWVHVVGHRDVPGRPELLATTRDFLDYFGLKRLDELPPLAEVKALGEIKVQFDLPDPGPLALTSDSAGAAGEAAAGEATGAVASNTEAAAGDGSDAGASGTEASADGTTEAGASNTEAAAGNASDAGVSGAEATSGGATGAVASNTGAAAGDGSDAGASGAEASAGGASDAGASNTEAAAGNASDVGASGTEAAVGQASDAANHGAVAAVANADSAAVATSDDAPGDAAHTHGSNAHADTAGAVTAATSNSDATGGDATAIAAGEDAAHLGGPVEASAHDASAHAEDAAGDAGTAGERTEAAADAPAADIEGSKKRSPSTGRGSGRKKKRGKSQTSDSALQEAEEFAASVDADLAAGDDDGSDEDELSAAGPDSSELVAGPRDIDD